MSFRKPRSDAKLLNLADEVQAAIADYLLSGMPYHQAREVVAKEFGVTASLGAFAQFYQAVCVPALLRKRSQAAAAAEQLAEEVTRSPGAWDQATVDAIKQKAFELAIAPSSSPKDVKALFVLIQKARDQDIKREELDLQRQKFQRETAELFLEHVESAQAREIAASAAPRASKIEELGQLMFGDLWQARKEARA